MSTYRSHTRLQRRQIRHVSHVKASIIALLAVGGPTVGLAAGPVGGSAIFGNLGVSLGQSGTVNGVVASNSDVSVNPFSTFGGLTGGGSLLSSVNGSFTVSGDVTFNGNVTTGSGALITGTINSGGNVDVSFAQSKTAKIVAAGNVIQGQSATTTGDILAGGTFTNQDFSVVNGNVFANAGATVNGTVNGNVTHGGALTIGPFGAVTGANIIGQTAINPAQYTPIATPAAIPFSSGGSDIIQSGATDFVVAPGSYGNLNIGTFGRLHLSAGDYCFNSFSFSGSTIYLENLTAANRLRIFVTGNVFTSSISFMNINGQPFTSADTTLAANVLLETLGSYTQDPLGDVQFFGTIFAPGGDITIGQYSSLDGSLIAGGHVNISVGFNESYVASTQAPEPGTLALCAGALGLLMARRRRRADAATR